VLRPPLDPEPLLRPPRAPVDPRLEPARVDPLRLLRRPRAAATLRPAAPRVPVRDPPRPLGRLPAPEVPPPLRDAGRRAPPDSMSLDAEPMSSSSMSSSRDGAAPVALSSSMGRSARLRAVSSPP
jgi:hypothetical protein